MSDNDSVYVYSNYNFIYIHNSSAIHMLDI